MSAQEPLTHTIEQGECLSALGKRYGLFPETIWKHAENSELRRLREDMNILMPGDRVSIPAIRVQEHAMQTEQRHRFRRKGVPAKLRIRLARFGEPFANKPYTIEIDGSFRDGQTDSDGLVDEWIPPQAQTAKIALKLDSSEEVFVFDLGAQDPIDKPTGVQQRLHNLGFECEVTGRFDEQTTEALKLFQRDYGLDPTGEWDEQTKSKLEEVHGS